MPVVATDILAGLAVQGSGAFRDYPVLHDI